MSSSTQHEPEATKPPRRRRATPQDETATTAAVPSAAASHTGIAPSDAAAAGTNGGGAPASGSHAHAAAHHAHAHHARKHATEVVHATRGRVRLKIPAAKRNPELLNQIRTAFVGLPGIDAIEVKPATGSLVIYYDPDHHQDIPSLFLSLNKAADPAVAPITAAAVHRPPTNHLEEVTRSIEEEAEFLAEHSHIARSVVDLAKEFDRSLKRATNNNIDLKIMVPIVLAGFTFLEIGAAAATPMWVTLMIFSLNHFVELHAHDADNQQS